MNSAIALWIALAWFPVGTTYSGSYSTAEAEEVCIYQDSATDAELLDPTAALTCHVPQFVDGVSPNRFTFDMVPSLVSDLTVIAVACKTVEGTRICSDRSNSATVVAKPGAPVLGQP